MKPKPAEAPDSSDFDAIVELEHSPGYDLLRGRILIEIARRSEELEGPHDEMKTANLRGQIQAYRTMLTIPEILKSEIQKPQR